MVTCPSGVQVESVLLEKRRNLADGGLLPEALGDLSERLARTGTLAGEPASQRVLWVEGLDAPPPQGGKHEVAYFTGCVAALDPGAQASAQGTAQLLERAGVDFCVLGADEVCCGHPLAIAGLRDQAAEMARKNVEKVREAGAQRVLTTCPSCYRTWTENYPQWLGEDPGVEVVHVSQWLAEADLALGPLAEKVTYQDPCDLGRGCGIYDAPRDFLSRVPGLELVEMPSNRKEALCCGFGGNMAYQDAEGSGEVAALRATQAAGTGAEALVTACPRCLITLRDGKAEGRLPVQDITEVAWRSVSGAGE